MTVIIGRVVDHLGQVVQTSEWLDPDNPRRAYYERRYYTRAAAEYRSTQPSSIVLDIDHGTPIGAVAFLEQDEGGLFAVCVADDADGLADAGPLYFSPATTAYPDGTSIEMYGLAVTTSPATVAQLPLTILPGTLNQAARNAPWAMRGRLQRARDYCDRRRRGDPHYVATAPDLASRHRADVEASTPWAGSRIHTVIECRSASTETVTRSSRIIEVLACPAEAPALIREPTRKYIETFARNAFAGEEKRAHRIKCNRDHDLQRTVGVTQRLDPADPRGLIAELYVSKTLLGDETLELAADHVLDASISFGIAPGGEQWTDARSQRRITKAFLDHIALVPSPAYETANVIAVRSFSL